MSAQNLIFHALFALLYAGLFFYIGILQKERRFLRDLILKKQTLRFRKKTILIQELFQALGIPCPPFDGGNQTEEKIQIDHMHLLAALRDLSVKKAEWDSTKSPIELKLVVTSPCMDASICEKLADLFGISVRLELDSTHQGVLLTK